jgi:predicted RNA binding protein YcfA (HicA-like mRNA interferase family)
MARLNSVGELISYLEDDGWQLVEKRPDGTRVFRHTRKPGRVTIVGNDRDLIGPHARDSVLRQAALVS